MDKLRSSKIQWAMTIGSFIGGIGGALLLGHLLHDLARMIFDLTPFNLIPLILPCIILIGLGTIGTAILAAAFFMENKKLKIATIIFSVPLPILVEIIDLSVRAYMVFLELAEKYPTVF